MRLGERVEWPPCGPSHRRLARLLEQAGIPPAPAPAAPPAAAALSASGGGDGDGGEAGGAGGKRKLAAGSEAGQAGLAGKRGGGSGRVVLGQTERALWMVWGTLVGLGRAASRCTWGRDVIIWGRDDSI